MRRFIWEGLPVICDRTDLCVQKGLFICIGIYLFFQKDVLNDYIPTFNKSYFIKQIDIM